MRKGRMRKRDVVNDHLEPKVEYLELFPDQPGDLALIQRIPASERTYSKYVVGLGPSPILVKKTFYHTSL